ncbi:MAG: hypothetical protein R3B47_07210 [Bacteroidia bacterium]
MTRILRCGGFSQRRTATAYGELGLLPDVASKSLLHLQCHFGLDTLGWAMKGTW